MSPSNTSIGDIGYGPWGQQWTPASGGYDIRFAKLQERDAATGFDPTLARQYDSGLGRWMTPDPENAGAEPSDPQTSGGAYIAFLMYAILKASG